MAATIPAYGQNGKTLVVYYSHTGNTQAVATRIQSLTGADIFRIETVKSYPADYRALTEEAKKELNENARPELTATVSDMDGYDVIYIGYPNWWGTMPMAVFTFLDSYKLAGKTIIPFCTHEGSGLGNSLRDLQRLCPESTVAKGLAIRGSAASSSGSQVESWIKEVSGK